MSVQIKSDKVFLNDYDKHKNVFSQKTRISCRFFFHDAHKKHINLELTFGMFSSLRRRTRPFVSPPVECYRCGRLGDRSGL